MAYVTRDTSAEKIRAMIMTDLIRSQAIIWLICNSTGILLILLRKICVDGFENGSNHEEISYRGIGEITRYISINLESACYELI